MAMKRFRKAASAGLLTVLVAATLVACAPAGNASISTESATNRQASGYSPSSICVTNYSLETIMFVGEFEMNRTGQTVADPSGPLKRGDTWCTRGFEAFSDQTGMFADAIVEVRFSSADSDVARFAARNGYMWTPYLAYGQKILDNTLGPVPVYGYWDLTFPDPNKDPSQSGTPRSYLIEDPYDNGEFIEWVIQVWG